jgi:outer membrane protein
MNTDQTTGSSFMHFTSSRLSVLAVSLLAATTTGAAEQDASADDDDSKSYSLGVGFAGRIRQQAYTGIDRDTLAIPLIQFENRWVELQGPRLQLKLPQLEWGNDQELSFGLGIEYDSPGYEPDDAPILNGMEERKDQILGGASAKWSNELFELSADWMFDVSGESKGQRISLGLERSFPIGNRLRLTPSATAIWLDEKYADYYYGVRIGEARADRPAYTADGTLNFELGLRADYMLTKRQLAFVGFEYTALGSEIKDSPLTDRSGEAAIMLGYLYRF